MCGIVGIISHKPVADRLLQGLKKLEYRGYDSSGIAVVQNRDINTRKSPGKIANLENLLSNDPINGNIGIAHTRWATHGGPSFSNAHPHSNHQVSVVHNGIIENYRELKEDLVLSNTEFKSETDTEVILHLISNYLDEGLHPTEAIKKLLGILQGSYALAIIFKQFDDLMIGARHGCPLAIGYGENEMFLGSDALALSELTNRFCFLEEGDMVVLTRNDAMIFDRTLKPVTRPIDVKHGLDAITNKGSFRHFMEKEIFEQPDVLQQTLATYLTEDKKSTKFPPLPFDWTSINRIHIVSCGTAYYAGLVAKHWFERIAEIPVDVEIASEFRYRMPPLDQNSVSLFISQSGETADTLAAYQYARQKGQRCLGIVNVPQSTLARVVDCCLLTYAGTEIGVASTKAFITQICVLALLSLNAAYAKGLLSAATYEEKCHEVSQLPQFIRKTLEIRNSIEDVALYLSEFTSALFLGRGIHHAIAYEGALKLKEISYIHAEGYPGGEMKHGPIALIDHNMPIIAIAPTDTLFEKMASNISEAQARHGKIILISDTAGHNIINHDVAKRVVVPVTGELTAPFVYAIVVQLIAYHTACIKGTDVDQPRNLAKSVTVE